MAPVRTITLIHLPWKQFQETVPFGRWTRSATARDVLGPWKWGHLALRIVYASYILFII